MKHAIQEVQLPTGETVANFSADLNSNRPKAIVDISVIKKLSGLLQTANVKEIIRETKDNLNRLMAEPYPKLEDYLKILTEEVAFHESINLINEYDKPAVAERVEVVR